MIAAVVHTTLASASAALMTPVRTLKLAWILACVAVGVRFGDDEQDGTRPYVWVPDPVPGRGSLSADGKYAMPQELITNVPKTKNNHPEDSGPYPHLVEPKHTALIVVDVQDCLMDTQGKVGRIRGGMDIVKMINRLREQADEACWMTVVFTRDVHPAQHISFASTHGKRPGENITLKCIDEIRCNQAGVMMQTRPSCCPADTVEAVQCKKARQTFHRVLKPRSETTEACSICGDRPDVCKDVEQPLWADHCTQLEASFPDSLKIHRDPVEAENRKDESLLESGHDGALGGKGSSKGKAKKGREDPKKPPEAGSNGDSLGDHSGQKPIETTGSNSEPLGKHSAEHDNNKLKEIRMEKGTKLDVDSYSVFRDMTGRSSGLDLKLKQRNVTKVVFAGLPLDVGVKFSALDAKKMGFEQVVVIHDASKGFSLQREWEAVEEMKNFGVLVVNITDKIDPELEEGETLNKPKVKEDVKNQLYCV